MKNAVLRQIASLKEANPEQVSEILMKDIDGYPLIRFLLSDVYDQER
ncbi:hypothetical protein Cyrtocomes_01148 [Candidatus Cyrtobacter comes]|uniref:Uncharacterized protein n=1 Tax=Candidatus Cyrtobacter comes TaxID=675776 RepID=A0ABU5L9F4_9RICK|nr:hypothetical protein [Candidatus Cyrtobacter comes]MDZ5762754.1 hypothetical protein [Candidatus Cyrtobacter comes]